jgi:hypothetical protein
MHPGLGAKFDFSESASLATEETPLLLQPHSATMSCAAGNAAFNAPYFADASITG